MGLVTAEKWGQVVILVRFQLNRIKQNGLFWFFIKIIQKLIGAIISIMLLPVLLLGHLAGFRRVPVLTDRIGHLAAEPDCLVKLQLLGLIPKRRFFMVAALGQVANQCLLEYWKPYICVVENAVVSYLFNRLAWKRLMFYPINDFVLAFNCAAKCYTANSTWGDRAPLLIIKQNHKERGWQILEQWGIPRNAWFACFHAREGGFSPADEQLHAYRNSNVNSLKPAMDEVVARGGWCIRMGDASMTRLEPSLNVVDYAHSVDKSDWMDIFLCAECRLFVGNTSGLFIVSTVFGVPCALANMIPIDSLGYTYKDVSIHKLLRHRETKEYLTYSEIFKTPASLYRYAQQYNDAGIIVEENSEGEIKEMVVEALDRDGVWLNTCEEEELQSTFKKLLKPHHYAYGSAARVGSGFLQRHRKLLT